MATVDLPDPPFSSPNTTTWTERGRPPFSTDMTTLTGPVFNSTAFQSTSSRKVTRLTINSNHGKTDGHGKNPRNSHDFHAAQGDRPLPPRRRQHRPGANHGCAPRRALGFGGASQTAGHARGGVDLRQPDAVCA